MPRTTEEIAADLDAIEAEDKEVVVDDNADAQEDDHEDDKGANEDPPGYISHEDWIAAGKDPDDYRGKNAYKVMYDGIQDNKALRGEIHDMKGMLTDVVDAAEQTRINQLADHKLKEQAILDEKLDTMEPKEAIDAQRKIDAIDDTPKGPKVNPVISTFITQNSILDPQSPDYNADFAADMISFHNAGADAMGGRNAPLSDGQVLRIMKKALIQAKELSPELFVSPRNNRGGTNRGGKGKGSNVTGKLSTYKLGDDTEPRNKDAAQNIYDMLESIKPGGGKKYKETIEKLAGEQ